ncbi:MAG: PAS-domain containing protein [Fimbriimonadaceae bacterium]|nr:PAS-domain containing protein [Fimbriimonadaceae bacterium]
MSEARQPQPGSAPSLAASAPPPASELDALAAASQDAVLTFTAAGRLVRANAAATRLLRLGSIVDTSAVACDRFVDASGAPLPPADHPLWCCLADGLPRTQVELYLALPPGAPLRLAANLEPVHGGPADGAALVAVLWRPESFRPEDQLSELRSRAAHQEHLVNLVFDNVDSGIAVTDTDDRLALWNAPFERLCGVGPSVAGQPGPTTNEFLQGLPWRLSPAQRSHFEQQVAAARESIEPYECHVETRRELFHIYTCRLAGGRRLWALRDLTERRRIAAELEAVRERAETQRHLQELVFANIQTALLVTDTRLRVVASNPRFGRMWHLEPEWLAAQPVLNDVFERVGAYFTAARFNRVAAHLEELIRDERSGNLDLETNDGRFIVVYTAPLENGGRLFSFGDLTERRELERKLNNRNQDLNLALQEQRETLAKLAEANRKLEEADKLKSEFLANTSHELRTPLNSILGYIDLIISGLYADDEELIKFGRNAYRSAEHLLAVINDLLDIARIESGRLEIAPEPLVVWLVIEEVCESIRPQLAAKGLQLVLPPMDLTLTVRADPARLRQVLFNILGNAVKFSNAGGITIRQGATGRTAWVTVTDTGIGIPRDRQEHIFEKFVQADGALNRTYGGTGLGLAICRSLLEMMGGGIRVESEGAGCGTTVRVELPRT